MSVLSIQIMLITQILFWASITIGHTLVKTSIGVNSHADMIINKINIKEAIKLLEHETAEFFH